MKIFRLLIVAGLMVSSSYAQTVKEALLNPFSAKTIVLNGQPGEAALLTKNGTRFKNVSTVIISGISDSVQAEQDLISIAACPSVKKVSIERCGFRFLSGAIRMLVSVDEVVLKKCDRLDPAQAFSVLAGMPSLQKLDYAAPAMKSIPRSFAQLRFMQEIRIHNEDFSIADGYARNTHSPSELLAEKNFQLGFGADILLLSYSCYNETFASTHLFLMRDLLQGVAFDGNELKLPQPPAAFKANHPLIKPPVAGLDVAPNVYTADAKSGGLLEYPSGTKIIIPQNAFVDKAGNPVSGNVTISYREFRDPVDIMLSGIPMKYDSAGQSEDFESAGMFEMNASVNGEEVFLAPGKKVDMDFAVVDTASTYNFYRLDEQKGWQYLQPTGKVEMKETGSRIDTASAVAADVRAIQRFRFLISNHRKYEPFVGDTTEFERIYDDTNYAYMSQRKDLRYVEVNMTARERKREMRRLTNWRWQRMSSVHGTTCFRLNRWNYYNTISGNNQEMTAFSGITWMLNDPLDRNKLKQLRSSYSGIMDVRMSYSGGNEFEMQLKFPWGFESYSVSAVRMRDNKPVAYSEKACMRMDKNYTSKLQRRKRNHALGISRRLKHHERWSAAIQADSVRNWKNVKNLMSPEEQTMDFRGWTNYVKDYVKKTTGKTQQMLDKSNEVYQALSVMRFGVYNCDQVRRIQNPVKVLAVAVAVLVGKVLAANHIYVIDKNRNQAFSYYGMPGEPVEIIYGAKANNTVLVVKEDGTLAVSKPEQFSAHTRSEKGTISFEAEELGDQPATPEMLRQLIYPEKQQQQ